MRLLRELDETNSPTDGGVVSEADAGGTLITRLESVAELKKWSFCMKLSEPIFVGAKYFSPFVLIDLRAKNISPLRRN